MRTVIGWKKSISKGVRLSEDAMEKGPAGSRAVTRGIYVRPGHKNFFIFIKPTPYPMRHIGVRGTEAVPGNNLNNANLIDDE